jgi:hypothetical protein
MRFCIFMRWLECHLRWRRSSIQRRRCYSGRADYGHGSSACPSRTWRPQNTQFWLGSACPGQLSLFAFRRSSRRLADATGVPQWRGWCPCSRSTVQGTGPACETVHKRESEWPRTGGSYTRRRPRSRTSGRRERCCPGRAAGGRAGSARWAAAVIHEPARATAPMLRASAGPRPAGKPTVREPGGRRSAFEGPCFALRSLVQRWVWQMRRWGWRTRSRLCASSC